MVPVFALDLGATRPAPIISNRPGFPPFWLDQRARYRPAASASTRSASCSSRRSTLDLSTSFFVTRLSFHLPHDLPLFSLFRNPLPHPNLHSLSLSLYSSPFQPPSSPAPPSTTPSSCLSFPTPLPSRWGRGVGKLRHGALAQPAIIAAGPDAAIPRTCVGDPVIDSVMPGASPDAYSARHGPRQGPTSSRTGSRRKRRTRRLARGEQAPRPEDRRGQTRRAIVVDADRPAPLTSDLHLPALTLGASFAARTEWRQRVPSDKRPTQSMLPGFDAPRRPPAPAPRSPGERAPETAPRPETTAPDARSESSAPRRRCPPSEEVPFYLSRAARISRERSVLEFFVDRMADVAADLHVDGRLPRVPTRDGPLPGWVKGGSS